LRLVDDGVAFKPEKAVGDPETAALRHRDVFAEHGEVARLRETGVVGLGKVNDTTPPAVLVMVGDNVDPPAVKVGANGPDIFKLTDGGRTGGKVKPLPPLMGTPGGWIHKRRQLSSRQVARVGHLDTAAASTATPKGLNIGWGGNGTEGIVGSSVPVAAVPHKNRVPVGIGNIHIARGRHDAQREWSMIQEPIANEEVVLSTPCPDSTLGLGCCRCPQYRHCPADPPPRLRDG